jgi:hypothetical protein
MISPCIPESIKSLSRKSRRLSKFGQINSSIISTRDYSLNRALTPTLERLEPPKVKFNFIKAKERPTLVFEPAQANLNGFFDILPKMPRSGCLKSKKLDSSFEQKQNNSISKLSNIYFRKARSKSSQKRMKISSGKEKTQVELTRVQEYLNDFHSKSKLLLEKLEQSVLGKSAKGL